MKNIKYIFIFLAIPFMGHSQEDLCAREDNDSIPMSYKWLDGGGPILIKMGVEYAKPNGFREVRGGECFKEYPKLGAVYSCLGGSLRSEDNQFIAFLQILPPLTREDSASMQEIFPNANFDFVDKQHIRQIWSHIRQYYGTEEDWKKHVRYYPQGLAEGKFNADTAIRASMYLRPEDYYKGDFKYVDILSIQKKGRGFVSIYGFYTDEAKARLSEYWEKIEGVYRYK